jgi:hypothetical protein
MLWVAVAICLFTPGKDEAECRETCPMTGDECRVVTLPNAAVFHSKATARRGCTNTCNLRRAGTSPACAHKRSLESRRRILKPLAIALLIAGVVHVRYGRGREQVRRHTRIPYCVEGPFFHLMARAA